MPDGSENVTVTRFKQPWWQRREPDPIAEFLRRPAPGQDWLRTAWETWRDWWQTGRWTPRGIPPVEPSPFRGLSPQTEAIMRTPAFQQRLAGKPVTAVPPDGEERNLTWYVPDEVLRDTNTGKFYDSSGQAEIAPQDAATMRQVYEWRVGQIGQPSSAEAEEAQRRWSSQMTQALMASARRRPREDFRPQMEATFEEWRRRLLGELTSPADWITRWQVSHAQNPFTVSEEDIIGQRIEQLETLRAERPEDQAVKKELQQLKAEAEAQAEERGLAPPGRPRPTAPPAPEWLPEFVPGLRVGQEIRRLPIPTPSGQQLTRMPWSQAQGLAGFAEWAGGRPWRDILGEAESMLPRTPVGSRNVRWRPAAQL